MDNTIWAIPYTYYDITILPFSFKTQIKIVISLDQPQKQHISDKNNINSDCQL